jgi:hypothetical protein
MINVDLLRAIGNATAVGTVVYVTAEDGLPLLRHDPSLIVVNREDVDPSDSNKVGAKITEAGVKFLNTSEPTKPATSTYAVSTGLVLPKVKRGGGGGGGAPTKYPFETMDVGAFFFVPNSDVKGGDALKTLGSAVGSANQRYAEDIPGTEHQVERAKRGADHKTVKDAAGNNVMETVTRLKKKQLRKFAIRGVEAGKQYGDFVAPANGAVVMRVAVE